MTTALRPSGRRAAPAGHRRAAPAGGRRPHLPLGRPLHRRAVGRGARRRPGGRRRRGRRRPRRASRAPGAAPPPPSAGRLLHRLADLIARDADRLAELETRDNGKLLREMAGQMAYLPEWYRYFAGLADKIEGSVIPSDKPNYLVYTRHEPVGVVAAITPVELPAAAAHVEARPGAGRRVHGRRQAERLHAGEHAGAGRPRRRRPGFPPGVVNVVTGWGPEVGKALTAPPRRRQDRLHRLDAGRQAHRAGRRRTT